MTENYLTEPIDALSARTLADRGLQLRLVDTSDPVEFTAWLNAESRGFHGALPTDAELEYVRPAVAYRRTTGVWDETGAEPSAPVATVSTWPTELTVPGARSVTSWAISAVTVATTHRRKGIARALLEAELRTANALGIPIAILTVSEATIYGRFGFAPVALGADWEIDTRRAKWSGPSASGRVQFLNVEQIRAQGRELAERARLAVPGEIELWDLRWNEQMLGDHGEGANATKNLRFVRYDDVDGNAQGFAIYSFTESPDDFSAHTLTVRYLVAVTDDAYAGLWRYLIEVDLVTTVRAQLRSADEPLRWQLSDFRAARKVAEYDHLWARILDVKVALEARRYLASGRFVLEIDDPLGFVAPRVLVDIAATGVASVRPFEDALPDDAHGLAMSINEISALYLGGGSAATLARAGRISELRPGSVNAFDAAFRSDVAPWLSLWF